MKLTVYTTSSCVFCHALLDWLDDLGVAYEELDASKNPNILSVPLTVIEKSDGTTEEIVGFDRRAIKKALKSA